MIINRLILINHITYYKRNPCDTKYSRLIYIEFQRVIFTDGQNIMISIGSIIVL